MLTTVSSGFRMFGPASLLLADDSSFIFTDDYQYVLL